VFEGETGERVAHAKDLKRGYLTGKVVSSSCLEFKVVGRWVPLSLTSIGFQLVVVRHLLDSSPMRLRLEPHGTLLVLTNDAAQATCKIIERVASVAAKGVQNVKFVHGLPHDQRLVERTVGSQV
jgi:hypothetical protein